MEELEGVAAVGDADADGGAVGEGDFFLAEGCEVGVCGGCFIFFEGEVFFQFCADACEFAVEG